MLLNQIVVLHHLLEVVGNVGTQVIAAMGKLPHRHFLSSNVKEDDGLNIADVLNPQANELTLHHFEKLMVQTFNQINGTKIRWLPH